MPWLSVQQNLLFSAAACQIRWGFFFPPMSSSVLWCDLSCSLKHKELLVFTQQCLRLPSEFKRLMAGVVCNNSRALLMGHQQAVGPLPRSPASLLGHAGGTAARARAGKPWLPGTLA